jgi:hypothetical protein
MAAHDAAADVALVREYAAANTQRTCQEPRGMLPFRYLIPSGFYQQCWDWDAAFMGSTPTALAAGSGPYLAGSMISYLHFATDDGEVKGCVAPGGWSSTLRHAKPVIVWGAWLAAKATGDYAQFRPYAAKMRALLDYWGRGRRYDAATGLHVWYDQVRVAGGQAGRQM